ncbi:MAG: MraY family glycosyltransferase [Pseudohongiellaceae bacterium]|nr:MraY family glycosyltransferase [Pseudohongiellaceae bacterium]
MSVISLFLCFIITAGVLAALRPAAKKLGLLDVPGGRKSHKIPTPLIGGLGIYIGLLSMAMLTPGVFDQYAGLLAISSIVLLVGIVDDAYQLNVYYRFATHGLCALFMAVAMNNQLLSFGNIVGLGVVNLGILAIPLTLFCCVGVINAINMADGMDGLSGGLVLISLCFLGLVAFLAQQVLMVQLIILLSCALLAFLAFNFRLPWNKSAVVYLGDAGSTMLGFIVAWLVIEATQGSTAIMAPVYALWFLAVPLMDTVSLLIKRPLQGRSPFQPGTDHLHHRLHQSGYSHKQIVLGLYIAAIGFGGIGFLGYYAQVSEALMFAAFMSIFVIYMNWNRLWAATFAKNGQASTIEN